MVNHHFSPPFRKYMSMLSYFVQAPKKQIVCPGIVGFVRDGGCPRFGISNLPLWELL